MSTYAKQNQGKLLLMTWKSGLSDIIKWDFFPAVAMSLLLYGCTTWKITKQIEKKLNGNYTRKLLAVSNKTW